MAGYVSGYMVPYGGDTSRWVVSSKDEVYVSTINQVPVLIPYGVSDNYPYTAGSNYSGKWWVYDRDVSVYGEKEINDSSTETRNQVASAYVSLFNRFPGPIPTENWTYIWRFDDGRTKYATVKDMIFAAGQISGGEADFISPFGQNKPYLIPFTRIAPQTGCTNSSANNYLGAETSYQTTLFFGPVVIGPSRIGLSIPCTFTAPAPPVVVPPTPPPTPTGTISLSPSTVQSGETSTLSWTISNATSSASIDNSVGSVSINQSGSRTITSSNTGTITYSLTLDGTVRASTNLTVLSPRAPHIKDNGKWRKVNEIYVKSSNSWKICKSAYVKINGIWKKINEQ
jgi:hypothetical protein